MSTDVSLTQIRIASPCPVPWAQMEGDGRVRFCEQCRLHVYNFTSMRREEAETLIRTTEGRLCAAFYQRADGTILTRDCPIGLRLARLAAGRIIGTGALVCILLLQTVAIFAHSVGLPQRYCLSAVEPFRTLRAAFMWRYAAGVMVRPPSQMQQRGLPAPGSRTRPGGNLRPSPSPLPLPATE